MTVTEGAAVSNSGWVVRASRYALKDRWISVRADDCTTPTGVDISPYYVIEAPDFVHVIASDEAGRIVFVRQYRHGMRGLSLELPGGVMDSSEHDPISTAKRELHEETGYTGGISELFLSLSPDPARYGNRVHFVRIKGVVPGPARPEATEAIEVVLASPEEAVRLASNGAIQHAGHAGAILASLSGSGPR